MTIYKRVLMVLLMAGLATSTLGCARAARDTTGFSKEQSMTVHASLTDSWQAVKKVLRDQGYELYTRDKRGTFVAYSPVKRRLFTPKRMKYTIDLESITAEDTRIYVEAVPQVYGVTLLTYPDWHDRPLADDSVVQALLTSIHGAVTAASSG